MSSATHHRSQRNNTPPVVGISLFALFPPCRLADSSLRCPVLCSAFCLSVPLTVVSGHSSQQGVRPSMEASDHDNHPCCAVITALIRHLTPSRSSLLPG